MKPKISLIICSKNRAMQLKRCLESIGNQEMLKIGGELIVVITNLNADAEVTVCKIKENASFPVKIINEPRIGKSHALNTGILSSEGEILVFTDDDCYFASGCLEKVREVFDSGRFQYCGGCVIDDLAGADPREKEAIIPPYGIIYPGVIGGTSMMVHKRVVDKIGLFDTAFGASTPFPVEDADYIARASLAGFTGAYIPEIIIYHASERKQGREIENHLRYWSYGNGAYFTKLILKGNLLALVHWPYFFISLLIYYHKIDIYIRNPFFLFVKELHGAAHYLYLRLKGFLKNK